ncbi:hypothetical protein NHX12_024423 [Muraenolepis orangiensis]|uniref:Uncharacterized protein n=1 Tax=Muraenolepis orangiensis TaxID=630683 RepID=A0A9Q0EFY7_9TELE|nr:hypothetical protein NHX12_024423 [Muraenolepis orangiensis]
MHGELIEFNERLYRSLMAKDHLIVHMRQELIDLRGPTSDDPSLSDFETAHRALINVWIPSVFLQGRAANAYHVYQWTTVLLEGGVQVVSVNTRGMASNPPLVCQRVNGPAVHSAVPSGHWSVARFLRFLRRAAFH